jgi:hypothetical protein
MFCRLGGQFLAVSILVPLQPASPGPSRTTSALNRASADDEVVEEVAAARCFARDRGPRVPAHDGEPDPQAALRELIELLSEQADHPARPLPTLTPAQLALLRSLLGNPVAEAAARIARKKRKNRKKRGD